MDKDEVIRRLKEHLRAKEIQNGTLNLRDKHYCIHYVEDFLGYKKNKAIKFLEDNIPLVMNL